MVKAPKNILAFQVRDLIAMVHLGRADTISRKESKQENQGNKN
jgi:hypothetical protein